VPGIPPTSLRLTVGLTEAERVAERVAERAADRVAEQVVEQVAGSKDNPRCLPPSRGCMAMRSSREGTQPVAGVPSAVHRVDTLLLVRRGVQVAAALAERARAAAEVVEIAALCAVVLEVGVHRAEQPRAEDGEHVLVAGVGEHVLAAEVEHDQLTGIGDHGQS
jgi:hypothetical protein